MGGFDSQILLRLPLLLLQKTEYGGFLLLALGRTWIVLYSDEHVSAVSCLLANY